MVGFPVVAQFGNGVFFAFGDEDRVEAEAFAATRLVGDPALEDPGAAHLVARGRDRDQLADVARLPARRLVCRERRQRAPDVVSAGPARRDEAGGPAEALDLDARILAEDPVARGRDGPSESRLRTSVLVVGPALLRGVVLRVEQLELPAPKGALELPQLVAVRRR